MNEYDFPTEMACMLSHTYIGVYRFTDQNMTYWTKKSYNNNKIK